MERFLNIVAAHRWRAITWCGLLCVCYVLAGELYPRARQALAQLAEWRRQRARIAEAAGWTQERAGILTRSRRLEERFAALYVSLPRSDQVSVILQVLRDEAARHGVALEGVRPAERIAHATYDELPFEIEVRGSFHGVGAFINRVEASRYLMKVAGLQLTSGAGDGADGLRAELTLSVIVLKEKGRGP